MATESKSVRVLNAALDESPLRGGSIILRGVIAPDSLKDLQTDDYQRQVIPLTKRSSLLKALENDQPLPDIEIGMRGESYMNRDGVHYMRSPMYIIDGLQRVSAALRFMQLHPGRQPRIGATVHFNTDRTWERQRFEVLNVSRVKVSPNVILRNRREDKAMLNMLHDLSTSVTNFPLYQRVSWEQRMHRNELISALMLFKTTGYLHMHVGSGMIGGRLEDSLAGSDRLIEKIGLHNVKNNVMHFANLLDNCWGVRSIQYRDVATQLKGTFLFVLARLLSDCEDFWRSERQLFVSADHQAKMKSFKIMDPAVQNLASSSGKSRNLLYQLMLDHLNSGKRSRRLKLRATIDHSDFERAALDDAA